MRHTLLCVLSGLLFLVASGCKTAEEKAQSELKAGIEQLTRGETDSAIISFGIALSNKPEFPEAFFYRALAYFEKREYEKAGVDAASAARLNQNSAACQLARGIMQLSNKQFDQAEQTLRAVETLSPSTAIQAAANRMLALVTKLRGSTPPANDAASTPPVPDPTDKSWVRRGFLGRSEFCEKHNVWAVVLYILGHNLVISMIVASYINSVGPPLNDSEKGTVAIICLLFGIGAYYLAWGYSYWGLWILCVFWTCAIGSGLVNKK